MANSMLNLLRILGLEDMERFGDSTGVVELSPEAKVT